MRRAGSAGSRWARSRSRCCRPSPLGGPDRLGSAHRQRQHQFRRWRCFSVRVWAANEGFRHTGTRRRSSFPPSCALGAPSGPRQCAHWWTFLRRFGAGGRLWPTQPARRPRQVHRAEVRLGRPQGATCGHSGRVGGVCQRVLVLPQVPSKLGCRRSWAAFSGEFCLGSGLSGATVASECDRPLFCGVLVVAGLGEPEFSPPPADPRSDSAVACVLPPLGFSGQIPAILAH